MTYSQTAPPLSSQPPEPPRTPPALDLRALSRWTWRQLTSMRSALILLMLLALAAVPGSLVPQERVDALAVTRWKSQHPNLVPLFERLSLFHVYGSPWFSAIYILLMVSLVGCILPRLRVYWRAATMPPPRAPRNFHRLPAARFESIEGTTANAAAAAQRVLRRRRYRIHTDETAGTVTLSAQRGYLREAGNLVFHLSLLVVLFAFAIGDLFGFRGGVILVDGQTFTNASQAYDDFVPGTMFDAKSLDPFNLTLKNFSASFVTRGPQAGQPTDFTADVTYRSGTRSAGRKKLQVNQPLTIGDTSIFLVGNGYAPIVTVRDGAGNVAYSGPTVFLPQDGTYASWGVIKVPDAQPTQLAFEGQFLPTYGYGPAIGAFSRFPDTLAPALVLTGYSGDLRLGSGIPQSVYALNKTELTAFRTKTGKPKTLTIPVGATAQLPDGQGSITFDGVRRWAKLQISSTPAEPVALGAVVLGLLGLLGSLFIRPRRVWLRIRPTSDGTAVDVGGLDRREGADLPRALDQLITEIRKDLG